ncbi:MAG: hypothetical protein ACOYO1_08300 [Bacteroidales bacterium]
MRLLSFIIWAFFLYLIGASSEDSPHGKDFAISCGNCHSSKGWALDTSIYSFNHSETKMPLSGQHKEVNCRLCHISLVFAESKTKTECINCHTDIHGQTTGNYCDRCHSPNSWLVNNITVIHQQTRFPLVGVHTMTECQKCHKSESLHRYDVLGVECIDCHRTNYMSTTAPNHNSANFSTDCSQCHNIFSYEWGGTGFNHNVFPLTLGHSNISCSKCHTNNNYSNLSTDCYSCHKSDYNSATNPVHAGGCYSTNCNSCHTTTPGWRPVSFQHEKYFPISSGKHSGFACNQCHTNPANCTFSCINCHEHNQSSMNNKHNGESGYSWVSSACYNCHPRGNSD